MTDDELEQRIRELNPDTPAVITDEYLSQRIAELEAAKQAASGGTPEPG
jgi:hypothetical protein